MDIDSDWRQLLAKLAAEKPAAVIVYVLGAVDTGKTTLCRFLVDHLAKHFRTAYIDCDPGQSLIGPPTTLGLRLYFSPRQEKRSEYLRFVGSTSPRGHLLQTVGGIKKLTEKALDLGAERIILDSSGYVLGKPGQEFQFQVLDLVEPDWLLAFQQEGELDHLLANFVKHPRTRTWQLPVSPQVTPRDMQQRQEYRRSKFREYFQDTILQEFSLDRLGLHGLVPPLNRPEIYLKLMVALCDEQNLVLTLGIVDGIDWQRRVLALQAPLIDYKKVATVQFGSLHLQPDGQELL